MNQRDQPSNEAAAGLRRFVEAARDQPIVATCVTAEAVAAGLEHRRRRNHARRIVVLSASMAVAASLIAVGLIGPLLSARDADVGSDDRHAVARLELDSTTPQSHALELANAVRMRSTADVEVHGPWAIALREGTHEIEVDPSADHALTIALPGRMLELVEGSVTIELGSGEQVAVRLHTGVAAWIDEHGGRSMISVERFDLGDLGDLGDRGDGVPSDPGSSERAPSAAELARTAEQQLATGKRDEAVTTYQQLVRKHPRASQTRAAVLDLARLLRTAGRTDEARCAYRLYLERWPDSAVRGEVESQLARLGDGPACRGLSPR
jgi:hypothetical protein